MDVLNASDAKREFGEMLLKVQKTPVRINKNGKPVAVVLSIAEYEQLALLREAQLKLAIEEGIADIETGRITDGAAIFKRLRDQIS
ncbi:MAG: type II toxin-antitoxin system Phd/YefM family antitoxin [Gammaproteobacteria bacterium]|nr:type II toxin-antitoxin system Phd/YefM family antitoxin [Gammaproteobacteria bacterium]